MVVLSGPHSWPANWTLRLSSAFATLFIAVTGTLNWRLQKVQAPIAGIVPIHLSTGRLRFGAISRTQFLTERQQPVRPTLEWLHRHGAGCDCEVIFNTEAEWGDKKGSVRFVISRTLLEIAKNPSVRTLNKPYGIAEATSVIAEMLKRQA